MLPWPEKLDGGMDRGGSLGLRGETYRMLGFLPPMNVKSMAESEGLGDVCRLRAQCWDALGEHCTGEGELEDSCLIFVSYTIIWG